MPFKSSLELYSDVVLPELAQGPRTLRELDVPSYAVLHLEAHGLIRKRSYRAGAIAFEAWFLPEHLALLSEELERPPAPLHCDELTDEDWPPDEG